MNLKTHTVYPEIQIDEVCFLFTAKLIDGKGNTKLTRNGKGKSRKDATVQAGKMLDAEADNFDDVVLKPKIKIDEACFLFTAKLIDGKGNTKFTINGGGKSRLDATIQAGKILDAQADKFLIEEGER